MPILRRPACEAEMSRPKVRQDTSPILAGHSAEGARVQGGVAVSCAQSIGLFVIDTRTTTVKTRTYVSDAVTQRPPYTSPQTSSHLRGYCAATSLIQSAPGAGPGTESQQ